MKNKWIRRHSLYIWNAIRCSRPQFLLFLRSTHLLGLEWMWKFINWLWNSIFSIRFNKFNIFPLKKSIKFYALPCLFVFDIWFIHNTLWKPIKIYNSNGFFFAVQNQCLWYFCNLLFSVLVFVWAYAFLMNAMRFSICVFFYIRKIANNRQFSMCLSSTNAITRHEYVLKGKTQRQNIWQLHCSSKNARVNSFLPTQPDDGNRNTRTLRFGSACVIIFLCFDAGFYYVVIIMGHLSWLYYYL